MAREQTAADIAYRDTLEEIRALLPDHERLVFRLDGLVVKRLAETDERARRMPEGWLNVRRG